MLTKMLDVFRTLCPSASYFAGPDFKSVPKDRLLWLKFFPLPQLLSSRLRNLPYAPFPVYWLPNIVLLHVMQFELLMQFEEPAINKKTMRRWWQFWLYAIYSGHKVKRGSVNSVSPETV
jgi:hypothetical protein